MIKSLGFEIAFSRTRSGFAAILSECILKGLKLFEIFFKKQLHFVFRGDILLLVAAMINETNG